MTATNNHIFVSLVVLIVALLASHFFFRLNKTTHEWHEGPKWQRFLSIYDDRILQEYPDCDSRLLPTRFGSTQVHACGDSTKPAVLMLHGAGSNSLIYGDWLIPTIRLTHYAVAVDFICDAGRSVPKEKNVSNCPQSQQELADWISDVVSGLKILSNKVSIIGYSYGSFIAACTAMYKPNLVNKAVFIAPAAVFAPIQVSWIFRAVVYAMFPSYLYNWFFKYMSADPDFEYSKMSPRHQDLTSAIREVAETTLAVNAESFSDEKLLAMTSNTKTMLIIGELETVVNSTVAVDTARRVGVSKVELYPKAGHLLLMEYPREPITSLIASFLESSENSS